MGRKLSWAESIRRQAKQSGLSTYMLAKRAGVPVSAVQVFMAGGGLRIETAEALGGVLGLELRATAESEG